MKILFYLGHPAHFHLFKNVISSLKKQNHTVFILIKKKDILEELLEYSHLDYLNILPEGRSDSKLGIAYGLLKRDLKIFNFARSNKPDLMLGTSTEITHVGKLLNIPSIIVNEDDHDAVPLFSKLGYPFASHVLAPVSCPTGKWEYKSIKYSGYHELAYLHPNLFKPDIEKIKSKIDFTNAFFILRFAKLTAHHDEGKSGLSKELIHKIIRLLEPHGKIYITAERALEKEFEKYRIKIDSFDMHHALAFASLYIGDSQTMAAEAAVLGTPSLRFNDFVGKLNYLEELEHKYGLTYGIKTDQPDQLLNKIRELLANDNLKTEWQKKRKIMLEDMIDVTQFMVDLIENYPSSVQNVEKL